MSKVVHKIFVYPIKGCKGIQLNKAVVKKQGLVYDRAWMIVNEDTGKMVTQRQNAKLALITTVLPANVMSSDFDESASESVLTLSAPGVLSPVSIPMAGSAAPAKLLSVSCWAWNGKAADQGDEVAKWLSQFLQQPCRLVKYVGKAGSDDTTRFTAEYATGFEMRFPDQYPVLLASQDDMHDLNSRMGLSQELSINRFRPNIILTGCQPWEGDAWRDLSFNLADGPLKATVAQPCSRCKVPSIDQATSVAGNEPLDTLNTFRTGSLLGWAQYNRTWTHAVFFGWQLVLHGEGLMQVGDTMDVDSRRGEGFAVVEASPASS